MPSFFLLVVDNHSRRDVPRKLAVSPIKPTSHRPNLLFSSPLLLHSFIHIHRVSLPFSFPFFAMPSPYLFLSLPDFPLPCIFLFLSLHCLCLALLLSILCIASAQHMSFGFATLSAVTHQSGDLEHLRLRCIHLSSRGRSHPARQKPSVRVATPCEARWYVTPMYDMVCPLLNGGDANRQGAFPFTSLP